MTNQYILGAVIASFLGFAVFYLLGKMKNNNNYGTLVQAQRNEKCAKTALDGECQEEMVRNPDVIIVGAGVAGSALACTLGKVIPLSYTNFV